MPQRFTIQSENSRFTDPRTGTQQHGRFISRAIDAFYHSDYLGGNTEQRQRIGTVENIICTLKNQFNNTNEDVLRQATMDLSQILNTDLPHILRTTGRNNLTVCVVPRAKAENFYFRNQMLFRQTISDVTNRLNGFINGTTYIIRHTNTITTHLFQRGYGGDGHLPYPGITAETCTISDSVIGQDILLIDDLYTKSINIDEDCIQALLDKGAHSVIFYAVGKTVPRVY
ncbi:MAG: amidophosphoribosyltransferase [Bacteroidales bacterium]|jgi:hypothetical protein|nr:amidophosphoribosyltransferase [Bacteroidales bacterium]